MLPKVTIIYNEPSPGRYGTLGEEKAVLGVLDEVEAVYHALTELGYPVEKLPLSPPLEQARKRLEAEKTDLVFNLFEGFDGRPETEAIIADFLSELGLTFTGCPGSALSVALDKSKTKALLAASGIDTPRYQLLTPETLSLFNLDYPCIVKPAAEDASHGLSPESVVYDFAPLEKQVQKVSRFYGGQALVEEFVNGREFNATVLGGKKPEVLPVSEIVYSLPLGMPPILTFAAKWEPESLYYKGSQAVCPAEITAETRQSLTSAALRAFQILGCSGYARVDFRLDAKERPKVIEINPNPDISPDSGAARQAKAAGMTYSQFIERLARLAFERNRMEPRIRPMKDKDRPAVIQIIHNTPQFNPIDVATAEELIDSYLGDPHNSDYHILVAEVDSAVAGYICYGLTPLTQGTWDVYWVAVSPERQGQGIGSKLLATAEDKIKASQGRLVIIETSSLPLYEKTIHFYQQQDYEQVARIADFYQPGDDKIIFLKRLN